MFEKILSEWAKEYKEKNLSSEVCVLINQANYDLWYGPPIRAEGGYPGFERAVDCIRDALSEIPRTLYIDVCIHEIVQVEPIPEVCEVCNGTGTIEDTVLVPGSGCEYENWITKCDTCKGSGVGFEPEYWVLDRDQILKAFVGKELVQYVR